MKKKQVKRYILRILLIFFLLILIYAATFLIFLLPKIMTDEAIPQATQDMFEIYWRIVCFPLQFIRILIPSVVLANRYFDLAFVILNLIIQSHIVYGIIRGVKYLMKQIKHKE
jgi:hypothetical protein